MTLTHEILLQTVEQAMLEARARDMDRGALTMVEICERLNLPTVRGYWAVRRLVENGVLEVVRVVRIGIDGRRAKVPGYRIPQRLTEANPTGSV